MSEPPLPNPEFAFWTTGSYSVYTRPPSFDPASYIFASLTYRTHGGPKSASGKRAVPPIPPATRPSPQLDHPASPCRRELAREWSVSATDGHSGRRTPLVPLTDCGEFDRAYSPRTLRTANRNRRPAPAGTLALLPQGRGSRPRPAGRCPPSAPPYPCRSAPRRLFHPKRGPPVLPVTDF